MPNSYCQKLPRELPKKRMAAGALYRNGEGDFLLVKPGYKDHWDLPGGVVELDESPFAACAREIREELGLQLTICTLLCLDYFDSRPDAPEGITFIFDGGTLSKDDIARITLEPSELTDFAFFAVDAIEAVATERMYRRIVHCRDSLEDGSPRYLENQRPPGAHS